MRAHGPSTRVLLLLRIRYGCVGLPIAGVVPPLAAGVAGGVAGVVAGIAEVPPGALAVVAACAVAGNGVDVPVEPFVEPVTGVNVTPTTSPDTCAFCFLLVVPRAARVAFAFALAIVRASADSG